MLFVGTQSDLLAYNVEANSDVWFKDAADGVSTLCFGRVPSLPAPLALVGGNCSIQVSFCPPCPSYV
jgi:Bardet-Biedl syndrome 2 protein